MHHLLRFAFVLFTLSVGNLLMACTAFTVTHNGRTYIGNNEDAWSINPQVRFEQGRDGGYGAIYFGHYNGHPLRGMIDQLGMNEMGLVYDGLRILHKKTAPTPGLRQLHFNELMPHVLRTCTTVQEAAALLRTYDRSITPQALIFMADKHGGWLIVENDTIIEGHDPWYAVGNWRMGSCSDPATIPIPRLQEGRQLLAAGTGGSLEEARDVLARMSVCRKKLGEGTLFSTLFDPAAGKAHLYFYHDFNEAVTFDLHEELAKGDRTMDMASLFGTRPEFERLKRYITPFHQRWLFWGMLALAALAGIAGLLALIGLVRGMAARVKGRAAPFGMPLLLGLVSAAVLALTGVLLMQEGVYYFGLGDAAPMLAWLPVVFILLSAALLYTTWRTRGERKWPLVLGATITLPLIGLLGYWGMWWP